MRALIFLILLISVPVAADESAQFLDFLCQRGFARTTMPKDEALRFCACVRDDVTQRLSTEQRRTIAGIQDDLVRKNVSSVELLASSGVRDLVVAGQARCEASFYPPSAAINISGGSLQLTLRCENETKKPEAFVYVRGMALLTKAEQQAVNKRMMKSEFKSEYAKVTTAIDGGSPKKENWEIDLTGEIVSPPNSAQLIDRLRPAEKMSVTIERGEKRYAGTLQIRGKIPARWAPCGGVGK